MAHVPATESYWENARVAKDLLFTPYVLAAALSDHARRTLQTKKFQRDEWPKPLTSRQLCRKVRSASTDEDAHNAGLFALLPCEIRSQIFEYAIGGRHIIVHYDSHKRRLVHESYTYSPASPQKQESECSPQSPQLPIKPIRSPGSPPPHL